MLFLLEHPSSLPISAPFELTTNGYKLIMKKIFATSSHTDTQRTTSMQMEMTNQESVAAENI